MNKLCKRDLRVRIAYNFAKPGIGDIVTFDPTANLPDDPLSKQTNLK